MEHSISLTGTLCDVWTNFLMSAAANRLLHQGETESVLQAISLAPTGLKVPAGTPGSHTDKRKTGVFPPEVGMGRKRELCMALAHYTHLQAQAALM